MKLYGSDAIEAFRQVLRETHPEEIPLADELIAWGHAQGLEAGLTDSSKQQLRFRMPHPDHEGRSVFCLNPQVGGSPSDVNVELQWLLKAKPFEGEARQRALIERLQRVSGWHRPPGPRADLKREGFPSIRLARLEAAGAKDALLDELGWIVDRLEDRSESWTRAEVSFTSGGIECAGWLYRPDGVGAVSVGGDGTWLFRNTRVAA
jgi:hypothetical protein